MLISCLTVFGEEEEDSELVNMNMNYFYVCAAETPQGTFKGHPKLDV